MNPAHYYWMVLVELLNRHGLSHRAIYARTGINQTSLCNYKYGYAKPAETNAGKLVDLAISAIPAHKFRLCVRPEFDDE